jgi:hypothetical protein
MKFLIIEDVCSESNHHLQSAIFKVMCHYQIGMNGTHISVFQKSALDNRTGIKYAITNENICMLRVAILINLHKYAGQDSALLQHLETPLHTEKQNSITRVETTNSF